MFAKPLKIERLVIDKKLGVGHGDNPNAVRLAVHVRHFRLRGQSDLEDIEVARAVAHGPRPPQLRRRNAQLSRGSTSRRFYCSVLIGDSAPVSRHQGNVVR